MADMCPHKDCKYCQRIERGEDPSMPLGPREMMRLVVERPADPDRLVYSAGTLSLVLDAEMLRLAYEDAGRRVGELQLASQAASDDAERRDAEVLLADAQQQLEDLGERLGAAMVARTAAQQREAAAHHQAVYQRGLQEQRVASQERSTSRLSRLKGRRS